MEERFYKVLNKILINFIPKTKLNQFKDLILENDIDIEKLYFTEQNAKEPQGSHGGLRSLHALKPNRQKLSIDEIRKKIKMRLGLDRRIFDIKGSLELEQNYVTGTIVPFRCDGDLRSPWEIINTSDKEEVLKTCDNIAKKIIYEDKKNKIYYYHFGKNLSLLKEHYCLSNTIKDFYNFIEDR